NAQGTLIAPSGAIGVVTDCDTAGLEPDFAVVKFNTPAGGGYLRITNQTVPKALAQLGYSPKVRKENIKYAKGTGELDGCPPLNEESLREKGFGDSQLEAIKEALPSSFDIKFAFNQFTLGEDFCEDELGLEEKQLADPQFNMLKYLGYSQREIQEANDYVC